MHKCSDSRLKMLWKLSWFLVLSSSVLQRQVWHRGQHPSRRRTGKQRPPRVMLCFQFLSFLPASLSCCRTRLLRWPLPLPTRYHHSLSRWPRPWIPPSTETWSTTSGMKPRKVAQLRLSVSLSTLSVGGATFSKACT